MKKKRVVLFTVVMISCLILFGAVFMLFSKTISPNYMAVSETKVSDGIISIKGNIAESGTKYKGYSISEKNGTVLLQIKGSVFSFGNKDSFFDIKIHTKKYGSINQILLHDGTHHRQIWPEK